MLTAEEFTIRMGAVEQQIAELSALPHDPASRAAAELLKTTSELHKAALQSMLEIVRASGDGGRQILERFAQNDMVRSVLLCHDLHPVDLQTRLNEAVDNLRPLVESYGGRVSVGNVSTRQVVLRLAVPAAEGRSPLSMLQGILEHAILVAAPDVAEVHFDDRPPSPYNNSVLKVISVS